MYKNANTFAAAVAVMLFAALVATFGAKMISGDKEIQSAAPAGIWNTEALGGEQASWVQASTLIETN